MITEVVHSGFDGLRVTLEADIAAEFRKLLFEAKTQAALINREVAVDLDGLSISVRRTGGMAFSAHTGDYGAEFYFLDPENRPPSSPGITVDFRAFLLATGGLNGSQAYFADAMRAFGVNYVETQLRISRIDFAVDFLAPWFEPHEDALILPARTKKRKFQQGDTRESFFANTVVTGLTAGRISNRQVVIYDKREEIITKRKLGWLEIWNQNRARSGLPPLNIKDRDQSQVWRFENRMGSKCLRRHWEIRSWFDLDAMVGDAFAEFAEKIRYAIPTNDRNRSRWQNHELWDQVADVYDSDLAQHRSGVVPDDIKRVNREEHKRGLDMQILGLLVSRAAAEGVSSNDFENFVRRHLHVIQSISGEHPVDVSERIAKAAVKYIFR